MGPFIHRCHASSSHHGAGVAEQTPWCNQYVVVVTLVDRTNTKNNCCQQPYVTLLEERTIYVLASTCDFSHNYTAQQNTLVDHRTRGLASWCVRSTQQDRQRMSALRLSRPHIADMPSLCAG